MHAHAHALDAARIDDFDLDEEHIVSKTARFLDQLLKLGDNLAILSQLTGTPQTAHEIIRFSRVEVRANGWLNYPELSRLAQVAPIAMSQQAFLSRCKNIHELWQRVPNAILRDLILYAGYDRSEIKKLGSLKLLQVLLNIVERLTDAGESVDAFGCETEPSDLTKPNKALSPLLINNNLRIADAHNTGDSIRFLEELGFDSAELKEGYGRALDYVFDSVISAFSHLNVKLAGLLERPFIV